MKDSYVAGLFDGEGSASIVFGGRAKYDYKIRVSLGNTNKRIIEKLRKKYGGTVREIRYDNPRWSDYYEWITGSLNGYKFLKKIRKYVEIKKVLVNMLIEFQEQCIILKKEVGEKKKYFQLSRELNRRGK